MRLGLAITAAIGLHGLACTEPTPPGTAFTSTTAGTLTDDDDDDDPTTGTQDTGSESDTTGGPHPTSESGSTDGTDESDSSGAPSCSPAPPPDPDWLHAYQDELVATLSGAAEVAPGVSLGERSTPAERSAAAAFLDAAFTEIGYAPQRHDYATGSNVWARLAANAPDAPAEPPVLVVGAHYDTVPDSPGANDNATGVALVLALARHLRDIPCRNRDVVFVLFDQEEIGLVGSDAFAGYIVDEGWPVESVHTIDQMGWDADGDRRVEIERPSEGLFEFYDGPAAALRPPVVLVPTQTGSTDHVSFRAHGLPAVGLTEEFVSGDTSPHYHLPSDAYATVDLDYLASTTVLVNSAFSQALDAG